MKRRILLLAALLLGATSAAAQAQILSGPVSVPYGQQAQRSQVIPKLHLVKFAAATTPVVCIVGDSTSTELGATQIAATELLWSNLKRRIREDNPGKSITFQNFAIGGQGWAQIDSVPNPTTWPVWYTNQTTPWLNYVQAANCDTLFFNSGINDANGFDPSHIKSVFSKVAAWTKVPDIILITNKKPARFAPTPYGTAAFQLGTEYAASYQRTLALSDAASFRIAGLPHIGLIDTNRVFERAVLGVDPVRQPLSLSVGGSGPVNETLSAMTHNGAAGYGYTLPQTPGGDFDLVVSFPSQAATLLATNGSTIAVGIGALDLNVIYFGENAGNITATIYDGAGGNLPISGAATIPVGTGDLVIEVIAKQEQVVIYVNHKLFLDVNAPRAIAAFQPWIEAFGMASPQSVALTLWDYSVGTPLTVQSAISEATNFGTQAFGPTGGNGINHSSSVGIATVDAAVLEATRFDAQ